MTRMIGVKTVGLYTVLPVIIVLVIRYIDIIIHRLFLCDYMLWILTINIVGLFIFLKNIKIDIELYWSIKYD